MRRYAAGEIGNLEEQLAVAARARNERLRGADLAAEVLALPAPRNPAYAGIAATSPGNTGTTGCPAGTGVSG